MKILVTGGNGQLGHSLQKIAPEYPDHTFLFTDMPDTDITDRTCIDDLVKTQSIELIVNCAAYTAVDKAESEPAVAEKINVEGPAVLADIAKRYGIGFIHISTDYVFSGRCWRPLKENHSTAPCGVYGVTKLKGETAIRNSGCKAAIIRTAWLYSEFGNNFVKTMLRLGKEREKLGVVYDQIGTPTYATDLAHAILKIAENKVGEFEIYHYSNEGAVSWYDFAKEIFSSSGYGTVVRAIESAEYPAPAPRPAYSVLAKNKIRAAGAEVPYWKDSLKVCLEILNRK